MLISTSRLLQAPKLSTLEQLKEEKRKAVEVEDYELLGLKPPFWWKFSMTSSLLGSIYTRFPQCKFQDYVQARMSHDFMSFDMFFHHFHLDSHETSHSFASQIFP